MKAFPRQNDDTGSGEGGMELREYAAIKLKVPNSGTDWLDEMIKESLKNDLAAKAMQGIVSAMYSTDDFHGWTIPEIANESYTIADAMMEARRSEGSDE